ncbi:protocadherin Fat 1-like isoform X6 [Symsagittifera roscoffensis]|uniref:protocadherin Fat 1-like isoform X6 n=1 Tax=Symsagittifera roscoffensis TaxID=84072 RepID=UPI00307C5B7B
MLHLIAFFLVFIAPGGGVLESSEPQFQHPIYHLRIQENAGPKTYCKGDRKIELNIQNYQEVHFKLVEEEVHGGSEIFKVEEQFIGTYVCALIRTKGGTTSSSSLNRERTSSYVFSLQAILRSSHQEIVKTTKIFINVLDVDDHPPYFLNHNFHVNLYESTEVGSSVFKISAVDSDEGRNGELFFTIVDPIENNFFLDPHSGEVKLVRPLSFKREPDLNLKVIIDDRGQKNYPGASHTSSRETIHFHVQQNNTEAPTITLTHLPAVIEHGLKGSLYAILKVNDNDRGVNGEIRNVRIYSGDPMGHFELIQSQNDPNFWDLKIAHSLDREDMPDGYNLTVEATDAGSPARYTLYNLPVHVIDTNDNKPIFQSDLSHKCKEVLPPFTPLFKVIAYDKDIGQNSKIKYDILSGNDENMFWLNPDNGWLFKSAPLWHHLDWKYYLNISATDQANFGSQKSEIAIFSINVIDENNHAPVTTKTSFSIDESVTAGSIIGSLTSGDSDVHRTSDTSRFFYKMLGSYQENNIPFYLYPNGSIAAIREIDFETMPNLYEFYVRIEDKGIPFSRASDELISILIYNTNDEKPLMKDKSCKVKIPFDIEATTLVNVEAVDPDGTPVSYKIIKGNEDQIFEINSINGLFGLSPKWNDYRLTEVTKYQVLVVASDDLFDSEPLLIDIEVNLEAGSYLHCEDSNAESKVEEMKKAKQKETKMRDSYMSSPFEPCCENKNKPRIEMVDKKKFFEVMENIPIGTTVLSFHMSEFIPSGADGDEGFASMLTSSISSGNEDACFTVDFDNSITYSDPNPTTFVRVKTLSPLDREVKDSYNLTLTAFDLSPPYHNYSVSVTIRILDENDNYPKFLFSGNQQLSYVAAIKENVYQNEPILQVKTVDDDLGDNSRVSYSLPIKNDFFSVDKDSGNLYQLQALDREMKSYHVFKIEAVDHGTPSLKSHAVINITVRDVNDNPPKFYSDYYKLRIPEDYPINAFIVQVKAVDIDLDSEVSYSFGFGDHHMLRLDSETGVILLARSLDYETQKVLNLSVIARDSATEPLSASANVVIEITDVDENVYAPEFQNESQYVLAKIPENRPSGSLVTRVFAVDYDEGVDGQVRYAIVGGDGHGRFSLNPITGEIHTLDVFDRETQQFYWLDVKAHDLAAVPKHSMLFLCVEIDDMNDNPPLPELPVFEVRLDEEKPIATYVGTVRATDADVRDSGMGANDEKLFHYRIKQYSEGYQYFQVHDGVIRTAQVLDRESLATDLFELEVEISDGDFESNSGLTSIAKVMVRVTDTNDHSPELLFDMNEVFLVPPAKPQPDTGKYLLHRVVVIDRDLGVNGELSYSILRVSCSDMEGGKLDGKGDLKVSVDQFGHIFSQSLPTLPAIIDLNLNVTDKGAPSNTKFFRIIINLQQKSEDDDSQGDFLMISQFTESEGRALPTLVAENSLGLVTEISVFSSPSDENDLVRPIILAGNDDNKFAIVGSNLVVAKRLNCEERDKYDLVIAATDGVKFSSNITFPITVLDVNEFSPVFGQKKYTVEVPETMAPGTSLYTLTATDRDCSSQVQFELDACLTPHSEGHFVISVSGDVVLALPLDHETTRQHILRVRAMDTGGVPEKADYAYVTIEVSDRSDNAPVFVTSQYDVRVFDTSAVGSVVTHVTAIDRDRGYSGVVTYTCDKSSNNYFDVRPETGEVTLTVELNQTMVGNTYQLQIYAFDEPDPDKPDKKRRRSEEPAIVTITVVTGEHSPPLFQKSEYEVSIKENQPFSSFVFLVPVICHSTVRFAIVGGDPDEMFDINPSTGAISVKQNLDFEVKRSYKLEIEATNAAGLKAYTFVKISLIDVNDNHPKFERTFFHGTVSEGIPEGSVILSSQEQTKILLVKALDKDSGNNGRIKFEILDEQAKKNFTIDANTGSLRTKTVLDFEEKQFFTFKVSAHNLGNPPLFTLSDAIVNITITDKNDCPPKFELPAYSVVLYQPTFDGVIVAQPKAVDRDSPAMTKFEYSIVNSNADDNLFTINPETGVITASASRSMRRSYSLTVQVLDFPVEPLSALVTVHVTVQEALGNYLLQKSHYNATIKENTTIIQSVTRLLVKEKYEKNTKLFRLRNNVDLFSIGLSNGLISTKDGKIFDREKKSSYFLQVEMRMIGVTHRALILVQVKVLDVNDNKPEFVRLPYRFGVKAGSPKSTLIGQVTALDRDEGENAVVFYRVERNFISLFEVDLKDGSLYTRDLIPSNQLQTNLHQVIVVEAWNKNNDSMRSSVNVTIEFMPQEAPMFTQSEITVRVPENTALGAQIAQLEAVSADASRIFYTIEQGDRDQQFDINFLTGWVSITSKLDYEEGPQKYTLIVRAWDSKVSHVFSNARLNVIVEDSNDSPPVFSHPVYRASISEGAAPGTFVVEVVARDADSGDNAALQYIIIASAEGSQNFQIDEQSGVITTKRHLDREKISEYSLLVQVHDTKHFDVTTVVITVNDINDCTPQFYHSHYSLNFDESEGGPRPFCLGKVEAYDLDIVNRDSVFYEIKSGNEQNLFHVEKNKGLLYIDNSDNIELEPFYNLTVTASDTVHTKLAPVSVRVTTINRHAPRFSHQEYYMNQDIVEHSEYHIRNSFLTVKAYDNDKGICSEITYSLIGDKVAKTYRIDPKTGEMFLRVPIDREDPELDTVVRIMASDGMGRHAFAKVNIGVKDINDQVPQFERAAYHALLNNPLPIGHNVIQVHAVDRDIGRNSEVQYSLSPNQPQDIQDTFHVHPTNGKVTILKRIGRPGAVASGVHISEDIISYQFFVQATDMGDPKNTQSVPVDVYVSRNSRQKRDDSEAQEDESASRRSRRDTSAYRSGRVDKPTFISPPNDTVIQLSETAPLGTVVFTVETRTLDTDPMQYSLMDTPGMSRNGPDMFEINSTGSVIKKANFDYQQGTEEITLVVVAQTSNAFVSSQEYRIKILDENNNAPKFESQVYSISLPEDFYQIAADTARHVITVSATDSDYGANGQIIYTMSGEASNGYFDLDSTTGRVYVTRPLDREERDSYLLTISAVDRGRLQLIDTSVVNVTIIDLNDNSPLFAEREAKLEVNESVEVGTVVMTLHAHDKDLPPNNFVFYYIQNSTAYQNDSSTAGNEDSKFNINQSTGDVYVHGRLDRERATRYELVIVATDGKYYDEKKVKVIITDDNDNAPQCTQEPKEIKIPEDTPIGTTIFDYSSNVIDIDAGSYSKITFSIVVPEGNLRPPFSIGPDSGILKISEKLDRESEDRYDLWIRATDGGGLFCTIKLLVFLLDCNDNAPRFVGHSEAAVVETFHINQLITKVRAIDRDLKENKTVEYRLIDSANARFNIDTGSGMISLARLLDQSAEQYVLKVEAYDQGVPRLSSTTEITIRVGSSKDKPPQFEQMVYQVFVSEATETGSQILSVIAVASEESEKFPISYSIVNGNDDKLFNMNSSNGSIFLNEKLDFERVRSYQLDVYAIQLNDFQKPLSDKCSVLINVTDSNDNAPYFPQGIIERDISEDTQHGVSIYVAQALDMDFNSSLTYHLVTKTPNFVITAETGVIVVGSALDYEQRTHFTLKIAAYDNGVPQLSGYMQLKLNIIDRNDNPPRFQKDEYKVHIPEDFPESDVLELIKVTDLDGPGNGAPFIFSVVGDYADKFSVDSDGVLKNTMKLGVGSYKFKVNVMDSGLPPASNEVPVIVEVYKASAEPPSIFNHEVFIIILEDTFPAGKIAELTAVDNDKHDQLSYWVHKQEPRRTLSQSGTALTVRGDQTALNAESAEEEGDGSLFFMQDSALLAQTNLDEGKYHIIVKVTDGIHTDKGNVTIHVKQVTHEMLQNAVTIELSEMTPHDFLSAYLVLFQTLMTMTVFASSEKIEVAVLSMQETDDHNLRVLFCVFETLPEGKHIYVTRDVVEHTVSNRMELIKSKLPIVQIVYDICEQQRMQCENNTVCTSVVDLELKLGFESYRSYSAKRSSFVTLKHNWSSMCKCSPRDTSCVETACRDNPCGAGRRCHAVSETTFRCECLASDLSNCRNRDDDQPTCESQLCTEDYSPMSFLSASYSGFVNYEVPAVELFSVVSIRLSFRLEARVDNGEMLSIIGETDYAIVDVKNGHVRFRTNKNTALNSAKKFNDGVWHYVEAFFDGQTSSICVDNIYCASETSEQPAGYEHGQGLGVDLSSRMVFIADRMEKRQEISQFRKRNSFDTLAWNNYYRYFGCIDDIFINDVRLPNPLEHRQQAHTLMVKHNSQSVKVLDFKNVETKCNSALVTLSSCANNPCFHGGTCRGAGSSYECLCDVFASGSRCETLKTKCGLSSTCAEGSICRTMDGSLTNYTCHCPKGIKGQRCDSEKYCEGTNLPCQNGGICDDRSYSFYCQCLDGFFGTYCENDINECVFSDPVCKNGGTCENTPGAYKCNCGSQYSGRNCEVLTSSQMSISAADWLFSLPPEVLISVFIILVMLFIVCVLLVTCVKYRNTKKKLRQNAFPLIPYPQYPANSTHSNQYLPYSKMMPHYPGYASSSGFPPSNTAGSTSSITNHSYARLPGFSNAPPSGPIVYYDRKGRPISPSNTIRSSIDYEHHKSSEKGSKYGKIPGLRVDLPPEMTNGHGGNPNERRGTNRRKSSNSDNDQHYATSCYMPPITSLSTESQPVMHYSDGGSSATCSIAGRHRDISGRIDDWEPFAEVDPSLEEPTGGPGMMRWGEREGEERTMESPNLTDEPASSNGEYSRGDSR